MNPRCELFFVSLDTDKSHEGCIVFCLDKPNRALFGNVSRTAKTAPSLQGCLHADVLNEEMQTVSLAAFAHIWRADTKYGAFPCDD